MKIKYKKLTGNPGFEDFVTLVWLKMCDRGDWRWFYFQGFENGKFSSISEDGKSGGLKLPSLKQPKDFDPKSIKSFMDVYDQLKEYQTELAGKELMKFYRFVKERMAKENQREIIRSYMDIILPVKYPRKSDKYKHVRDILRTRLKDKKWYKPI